ncbi:aminopeptidase P family protein [Jatrophihabitans sp. YIM 134969]
MNSADASPDTVTPEAAEPAATEGAESHDIKLPGGLAEAISHDWDPAPPMPHTARPDAGPAAAAHRAALSARYPGRTIVVPSGRLKTRANDTEYGFRPDSTFAWLTAESEAEAVLVMTPAGETGHDSTLYIREFAGPGTPAYFTNRMYGSVWVGNVPSVADTEAALGVTTRSLDDLPAALANAASDTVTLRGVDVTVDEALPPETAASSSDLLQTADELKLTKDAWEIDRLREACEITARGFADVVRELPDVLASGGHRGERWLEGTFWRRARLEGNEVGYSSILGSGAHATTLHWWRNDGRIEDGQLLLADMGVETTSMYTADVTRTLPVNGRWTEDQLKVYRAVFEAQAAGIDAVKAGADYLAANRAAMWVLADHLHHWGILPVTAEVSCGDDPEAPGAGLHRRYTLHNVSHMLGIDVHDCATARNELYRDGRLEAGMVLTVEPGLYFQPNDRTVPAELRGIGVRIEDDILVTDGEAVNLSEMLPREPDAISEWMRASQASRPLV